MSINREDIERVAQLAALKVDEDTLATTTEQIGKILEYVSQLSALVDAAGPSDQVSSVWLGTDRPQAPRPDDVAPPDLHRPLEHFAPALRERLFLVPRLAMMEDE